MIRAKLNAIAAVRNRLRTFSMPRSQVRRAPPVSHKWANVRSTRSLRNRCRRRPRLPVVLRRLRRYAASRCGGLFFQVRFVFRFGSGIYVR